MVKNAPLSFGEIRTDEQMYRDQCEKIFQEAIFNKKSEVFVDPSMIHEIVLVAMLKSSVEICFFLGISPEELQNRTPTEESQKELAELINQDTRIALRVPDNDFITDARDVMIDVYQALKVTPEEFTRFARYKRYQVVSTQRSSRL